MVSLFLSHLDGLLEQPLLPGHLEADPAQTRGQRLQRLLRVQLLAEEGNLFNPIFISILVIW